MKRTTHSKPDQAAMLSASGPGLSSAPCQSAITYFHGDAAVYTGKSEVLHGELCYEIRMTEGHMKGKLKWTYRPPVGGSSESLSPCQRVSNLKGENMKVKLNNLWLCSDCTQVACNGTHGIETPIPIEQITAGLKKLGSGLVPNFDSESGEGLCEFSGVECDSCGTCLAGYRARFAILE